MHVREPGRQHAVAAEGEDHARRTEDVAGDKSERGDRRAGKQNGAADVAEKFRGCFGKRRVLVVRQIGAERSLRDELDQNVNDRGDDEREIHRARNSSRRIFHFAAGDERDFDSDESEHQQHDTVA